MHEFAIVESMLHNTLHVLDAAGVQQGEVAELRFRRGSTFSEDALYQTFEALSAGTVLQGVSVTIDTENITFHCTCGHEQVITTDDLIGHMFVCPSCGVVQEVEGVHDLELTQVIFKNAAQPLPSGFAIVGGVPHRHAH